MKTEPTPELQAAIARVQNSYLIQQNIAHPMLDAVKIILTAATHSLALQQEVEALHDVKQANGFLASDNLRLCHEREKLQQANAELLKEKERLWRVSESALFALQNDSKGVTKRATIDVVETALKEIKIMNAAMSKQVKGEV